MRVKKKIKQKINNQTQANIRSLLFWSYIFTVSNVFYIMQIAKMLIDQRAWLLDFFFKLTL